MAGLEGRLLDRYEIQALIGKGGMADVYRAYDPRFERIVAVKIFKREDEEMLRRFIREARLMAALRNPHLMRIYDAGGSKVDGVSQYYIVMPFMEGGTLRARIRHTPLTLTETCRYLYDIANALDYIHAQGIVHRDIKSSNVLLDGEGRCYLSDLGIARTSTDATQLTNTGSVLGTVEYVAPELFEPDTRANARSDLYSLGVLLYEMVTGQVPFWAENQIALVSMHINKMPPSPRSKAPHITPQVERVILKSLEKRPELRHSNSTELADAFCWATTTRNVDEIKPGVGSVVSKKSVDVDVPQRSMPDAQMVLPAAPPTPYLGMPAPLARETEGFRPAPQPGFVPGPQDQFPGAPPLPQPSVTGVRRKLSPTRKRIIAVSLLAFLTLLAIIGPAAYVLMTSYRTTEPNTVATEPPNQTATIQSQQATATQQGKNATATVVAGATATVNAQAAATAGVLQTAVAKPVVYEDALTNADNEATVAAGWDKSENCVFQSDGYHVRVGQSFLGGLLAGCRANDKEFADFTMVVDMQMNSGNNGGFFFRMQRRGFGTFAGYLFVISKEGEYKISRSNNFSTDAGDTLQNGTVKGWKKDAKNTLQLIAQGNSMSFYVNGIPLEPEVTLQDTAFNSGNIALVAITVDGGEDADVVYTNLKVFGTG